MPIHREVQFVDGFSDGTSPIPILRRIIHLDGLQFPNIHRCVLSGLSAHRRVELASLCAGKIRTLLRVGLAFDTMWHLGNI